MGMSLEVVRKTESGKPIRVTTASKLASVLGRSVDELRAPPGESISLHVVSVIRGLPGVGKTTMAAMLAHDVDIKHAFEGCLWASLGQSPDSLNELKAWGRALGIDLSEERDTKYARARLTAILSNRRMLLIIDDAWSIEPVFDLMVGGAKCATIVTTRDTDIANEIAPSDQDLYPLNVLTIDDGVLLLEGLAANVVARHRQAAKELAKELECLPLALQVAGRLVRAEERKGLDVIHLLRALQDPTTLLDVNAPGGPKVGALLKMSTDVLTPEARTCFAYLSPFAVKPATFDQEALNAMWEGLTVDTIAMRDQLIGRGLLEPQGQGRFWLHALLLAHAKRLLGSM